VASRDWINPSAWPFSCSCTADLIIESDVQQSENDPTDFGPPWTNLAQSSDSAYHSGTETVLARTLLFFVGLFFTFLMSRSTEFPLKFSPRLRELIAAYGKFFQELCIGRAKS